jgi:hypothetical protein
VKASGARVLSTGSTDVHVEGFHTYGAKCAYVLDTSGPDNGFVHQTMPVSRARWARAEICRAFSVKHPSAALALAMRSAVYARKWFGIPHWIALNVISTSDRERRVGGMFVGLLQARVQSASPRKPDRRGPPCRSPPTQSGSSVPSRGRYTSMFRANKHKVSHTCRMTY